MSYIGNEPIVSATRTVTEVTATAGQTVFNANGGYTVGYLDVFLNGSKLTTTDFTATNGSSITLTESAQVGDIVRLEAWGTFSTSNLVSPNYTGTLTGGTGVVNIGSGQVYKDVSGNVGIGTSSPTQKLDVTGNIIGSQSITIGTSGLYQAGSIYSDTNFGMILRAKQASPAQAEFMLAKSDNTALMNITTRMNLFGTGSRGSTGAVIVSGEDNVANLLRRSGYIQIETDAGVLGINYFVSDERKKKNIEPCASISSNLIKDINFIQFDWKEGSGNTGHVDVGVSAQQLQSLDSRLVHELSDGSLMVNEPALVTHLAKALQEQQALIQSQADTITAMELRLTALEGKQ